MVRMLFPDYHNMQGISLSRMQKGQFLNQPGKLVKRAGIARRAAILRGLYAVLYSSILLLGVETAAQGQSLVTRHVRQDVVSGKAQFLNRLSKTQTLRLDVVLPLRDPEGLEEFLQDVYNPSSPSYRHFLTVQEFTARFGPTEDDYEAVIQYATSNGLK